MRGEPGRNRSLLALLGVVAAVLSLTSNRYGYYHDEMYFLVAGRHPAWGYPDQPPLTPMLARLGDAIAPGEVWAVQIPATACTVLTVLFVALLVCELGGSPAGRVGGGGGVLVFDHGADHRTRAGDEHH